MEETAKHPPALHHALRSPSSLPQMTTRLWQHRFPHTTPAAPACLLQPPFIIYAAFAQTYMYVCISVSAHTHASPRLLRSLPFFFLPPLLFSGTHEEKGKLFFFCVRGLFVPFGVFRASCYDELSLFFFPHLSSFPLFCNDGCVVLLVGNLLLFSSRIKMSFCSSALFLFFCAYVLWCACRVPHERMQNEEQNKRRAEHPSKQQINNNNKEKKEKYVEGVRRYASLSSRRTPWVSRQVERRDRQHQASEEGVIFLFS